MTDYLLGFPRESFAPCLWVTNRTYDINSLNSGWDIFIRNLCCGAVAHQNGKKLEVGLLLESADSVIVGSVNSQLLIEFIDDLLMTLAEFHHFYPKYKGYRLYGAVAGLDISQDVARYATRRGFFVLSVTGNDTVHLLNDLNFAPRDFGKE